MRHAIGRNSVEDAVVDKVTTYFSGQHSGLSVLDTKVQLWKCSGLPDVPLQPDVDLLLSLKGKRQLQAYEVKVITLRSHNSLAAPYYRGLDEALALLRFGVDNASLFEVFLLPQTSEDAGATNQMFFHNFFKYQKAMVELIRFLKLPIGYRTAYDFLWKASPRGRGVLEREQPIQVVEVGSEDTQLVRAPENPYLSLAPSNHPCFAIRDRLLQKYHGVGHPSERP